MITDSIQDTLKNELLKQTQILNECENKLAALPEGALYIRHTGKNSTCYHSVRNKDGNMHRIRISDNPGLIKELIYKARYKAIKKICRNNIPILKRALKGYIPLSENNLISEEQANILKKLTQDETASKYSKATFDPTAHKHIAACGELVRSKSEVIIANALSHFNVPFNYEEKFPFISENGKSLYPDFTIHCPSGETIIWEHWGLLSEIGYCINNAHKVQTYHNNGFSIGRNLILTQDDNKGNCDSQLIYHIIKTYVLPHFQ